jgi:hypothetical protein
MRKITLADISLFCSSMDGHARPASNGGLSVLTHISIKEAPMNDRTGLTIPKRRIRIQKKIRSTRSKMQDAEWERVNDQLDDALRQTFPASDALSIIQIIRCS